MTTKKEETGKKTSNDLEKEKLADKKDIQENKAIAILSYLGILFIIPLIVKPESKFAKFHAKQGLVLTIGWVIGGLLYPFFGLGVLVHLAVVVFSIVGIINVSNEEMKDLVIVGDLAKKFNF